MKNNPQVSRVLEIFWLIVAILTLIIGFYDTLRSSIANTYMFFIMSGLAFLLYMARRSMRRKAKNN
ncbi:MAG TPA: hypothetical protein DDX98_01425 [Bacteroidales bacterium]|jgi:hypothetical protein|nr:hypothetical protein [Bacteroidales bacterium]